MVRAAERAKVGRSKALDELRQRVRELEAQLNRERRAIAALRDVAGAVGNPTTLTHLLELVLSTSAEVLEAERATLYLMEDETGELVSQFVVGDEVQTIRVAVGQGIAGSVVKAGKPIRVPDAYGDSRFSREWDATTGYRTRSILAAPMKNHFGETIGVLQVLNKKDDREFTEEDENLLTSLAVQAGISIDNGRLFLSVVQKNEQLCQAQTRLERKVADLKLLFELESAMAWATTQDDLASAVLSETVRTTKCSRGTLIVREPVKGSYTCYAVSSERPGELERLTAAEPCAVVSSSMDHGAARETAKHFCASGTGCKQEEQLTIAVPLSGEDDVIIGTIALFHRLDDQPFSDDDMELLRLVGANASTAISLLRAREARNVSERLSTIGRLVSGVLHDLKTPMTVIGGYAQLLATTENKQQRAEYSDLIFRQFDHITAMQKEVLAFARGERSLLISRVYLVPFFEEIRQQIERELDAGSPIAVKLIQNDKGIARFDQVKMTRALHNLARNAMDAMRDRGGELTIEVSREKNGELVISVRDTGPGIPKEIEAKLFESFVSAGKQDGTGLGLAIVKKIVEEHGGSVSASSSQDGAVFTIRLPQQA